MTTLDEPEPDVAAEPDVVADHELLEPWEDPPGLVGFLTTVDHKRIGVRYIVTSFVFFFIAGAMALVMRGQLSQPENHLLTPETYNQLFTAHGTTMIFLFNTPVLAGFGNYLLPLMLGSRDMAFPRLNAFSYWVFLFSGIFIYLSFLVGHAPDGGWFAYVPLTSKPYTASLNQDFWGLGVIFVGISTTAGAVNFLVTAFKMRGPGMSVRRMPLFVWSIVGMAFMVIFSVPALTVAAGLNEADRLFGTQVYRPGQGGDALLYQHLFWFWGHPEVYILFLPATGMISSIIPVAARRRIAGYVWVVGSLMAIAFISFGVWVHHMFATGGPAQALGYFSAASYVIAVPSGVLFFCWIATLWGGKVHFHTPMLFSIGFLVIFLLGGVTGVMVATMPFDWQAHDSYFVVAHFHYVLNGAVVFPIFGALYHWVPKMTGRLLSERLGKWSFWTMFVGFNVSFFPMHVLGLEGMPRRVYTYPAGLGWTTLNVIASAGAGVFGLGALLTAVNLVWSRTHGAPAPADPWGGSTLEWSTSSPPPEYNFAELPVVTSADPLWEGPLETVDDATVAAGLAPAGFARTGTLQREMTTTRGIRAVPEEVLRVPEATSLPFWVALALFVFFIGLLVDASVVLVAGLVVGAAALVTWAWRTDGDLT